jgi:hypothetical protein
MGMRHPRDRAAPTRWHVPLLPFAYFYLPACVTCQALDRLLHSSITRIRRSGRPPLASTTALYLVRLEDRRHLYRPEEVSRDIV